MKPPAPPTGVPRVLASLLRFFGLWAGITGACVTLGSGVCPCCGKPGCPVGISIAGIFGAVGSLLINYGRRGLAALRARLGRRTDDAGH